MDVTYGRHVCTLHHDSKNVWLKQVNSFILPIKAVLIFNFLGVPGIGPYGFVGTNVPGFPTGYPLGTKWKMTEQGYVLDHSGFQHPLSPHSGELRLPGN